MMFDFRDIDPRYLYSKEHTDYVDVNTYINPLKVLRILGPDRPWGVGSPTVEEVKTYLEQNLILEEATVARSYENLLGNDIYHVQRVKYFVNHPEEILCNDKNNIKIWIHFKAEGIYSDDNFYYEICDGNHRLYAASIAGMKSVECHFKGSQEFLRMIQ